MQDLITLYKAESAVTFNNIDNGRIEQFVTLIMQAYKGEHKILACGNGGNAAYVANLITDLNIHPFVSDDKSEHVHIPKRLYAVNLCESPSTLTALMNDLGDHAVFSEQVRYIGKPGDLLIGISGSGTSTNIINAMNQANMIGMSTILLTKNVDCPAARSATCTVVIEGDSRFPGQTGGNNNNFHFEDCISKLSHIATGILKQFVQSPANL